MLPLLPAILLLLLQGSAGSQSAAWGEQLPGAITALHRQLSIGGDKLRAADEAVFASLLAASTDEEISKALLQILTFIEDREVETKARHTRPIDESPPIDIPRCIGDSQAGFFDCRRTRDGPTIA